MNINGNSISKPFLCVYKRENVLYTLCYLFKRVCCHSTGWKYGEQYLLSNLRRASACLLALGEPSDAKLRREGIVCGFISKRLAISSPFLHSPKRTTAEFAFPLGEPNLNRSRRQPNATLFSRISFKPSQDPDRSASNANASSVIPALSSTKRSMSKGIAPAATTLTLFAL